MCLGTGDTTLEDGLRWLEGTWPDQARGWVGFNVPFSHRLTAAADILLMPSRFEPCGLNQMYAMTYGTVPVAHATGVLLLVVASFAALSGCIVRVLTRHERGGGRSVSMRSACEHLAPDQC